MITQARLKDVLDYDPATGIFIWKKYLSSTTKVGEVAGDVKPSGYRFIGIDGSRYRAHRLACLWMTGHWPTLQIDHKNTNRDDNWWSNLRPATNAENGFNSKKKKNNTSGYKGVFWSKQKSKWAAKINPNRKQVHLGFFTDPKDAHAAYKAAAEKMFGKFARAS